MLSRQKSTDPEHRAVADTALVARKVPAREGQRDGQLPEGQDELRGPEVAKDHVQEGVLGVRGVREFAVAVGNVLPAAVLVRTRSGGDGPAGGQEQHVDDPRNDEDQQPGGLQHRQREQGGHGGQSLRGLLDDADRQLDALPHDQHETQVDRRAGQTEVAEHAHGGDLRVAVFSVLAPAVG
jgi:hypothetical protein